MCEPTLLELGYDGVDLWLINDPTTVAEDLLENARYLLLWWEHFKLFLHCLTCYFIFLDIAADGVAELSRRHYFVFGFTSLNLSFTFA